MNIIKTDLVLLQGATFRRALMAYDAQNNAVDWSGYKARMQIRQNVDSGTVIKSLTTENGGITLTDVNGSTTSGLPRTQVRLFMSAADTDALTFDLAQYDLEIYDDTVTPEDVCRAFQGQIVNNKQITR